MAVHPLRSQSHSKKQINSQSFSNKFSGLGTDSMGEDLPSTHNWVQSPIPPKKGSQLILPQGLSDGLFSNIKLFY